MRNAIERLINLLARLRTAGRPLRIDEIRWEVPGYSRDGDDQSFRRMFERDKAVLRAAGIPLETVVVDEFNGEVGYVLPPDRFEMVDPGLTDEEVAALWLAARMVRMGGEDVTPALHKLGGAVDDGSAALATANLGDVSSMGVIFEAVTERRRIRVTYHDKARTLAPYAILHANGRWYLAAGDDGVPKLFRVDRGSGWEVVGDAGAFDRPEGLDVRAMLSSAPWEGGDQPVLAEVRFDADVAWLAERQSGTPPHDTGEGWVVLQVPVANRSAFLSWVLDFGTAAEVLGPPDLRSLVVDRIRGVA